MKRHTTISTQTSALPHTNMRRPDSDVGVTVVPAEHLYTPFEAAGKRLGLYGCSRQLLWGYFDSVGTLV